MASPRPSQNIAQMFLTILAVLALFGILPLIVWISLSGVDDADAKSQSFIGFESSLALYVPLDEIEHQPLQIEVAMMNEDADPCEDPVDYWCGGWTKKSGVYRKIHPISFSEAQQHAVRAMSTIVALELERTWDPSPVSRFHQGCTRTRTDPSVWGEDSKLFKSLLADIREREWNGQTMAELFGRLSAVGADIPFFANPIPNPTDTIKGGWVIELVPDGMIGSGDYMRSEDARIFHVKNWMNEMIQTHRRRFETAWLVTDRRSNARRLSSEVVEALRLLSYAFQTSERVSCWRPGMDNIEYFEDRECWKADTVNASAISSLGHPAFEWSLFFGQLGADLDRVRLVWTPTGNRWVRAVTNPEFMTEHQWRVYLEMSLRFATGQPMPAEWFESKQKMGAVSAIAHGSRHRGWTTDSFGTQWRQTRRKHWLLHLSEISDGRQTWLHVPIAARSLKNGVEMLSAELCTELTFVHLQPLFEHYYIEALGLNDETVRRQIGDLVTSGVEQFKRLINRDTPSWTASTRALFVRKLDQLLIAIGSPPYQRLEDATFTRAIFDNTFPDISVMPNSLVENMFTVRRRRNQQRWSVLWTSEPRLGTPTEDMPTYEVNAYYDPSLNSITLLAGILQAPFFSLDVVDPELLYSRMLAIIGHELGHAVDPSGRWTDWSGSMMPPGFWTSASRSLDLNAFHETETCLIDLYNEAVSSNGNHDDGRHTLGENMADTIGLRVAYEAMTAANQARPLSAKKFFGGWAQSWCARLSGAEELDALKTDVHSLHEFRIAVPFGNMPEYANAFKCKEGSKMKRSTTTTCDFFH